MSNDEVFQEKEGGATLCKKCLIGGLVFIILAIIGAFTVIQWIQSLL